MMRKDIFVDSDNELVIADGDFSITSSSLDYVREKVQVILRWFLGEWFYDTSLGIDYYGSILKKNPSRGVVEDILKGAILNIEEIDRLTAFSYSMANPSRTLTIEFSAVLVDGTEITEEEVSA